jgi:hypothetical protein
LHRIVEDPEPSVGLLIATFAAVPYVHLALESRRRHFPGIPALVHDDGSPEREQLAGLCARYDATFTGAPQRANPSVGDVAAFVSGLDWAAERGFDLLVKMSRRFIALHNWTPGLQRLAYETQYATYSMYCGHFNFGFRTECIALHVKTWLDSGVVDEMRALVARNEGTFVEGYLHNLARAVQKENCELNSEYELVHPRPPDADAYGLWDIMADKRTTRKPDILWHDSDEPVDYCRVALLYGLRYTAVDFEDPNQGHGAI